MYRQYVLHCAFDAILASNRPSKKNDAAGIVPEGDALTYINLLDGICYAPSASGDDLKGIRIEGGSEFTKCTCFVLILFLYYSNTDLH